jgi:hypothetical protein
MVSNSRWFRFEGGGVYGGLGEVKLIYKTYVRKCQLQKVYGKRKPEMGKWC